MQGTELFDLLINASGLPSEGLRRELDRLVRARGLDPRELTLDAVREIMALYVQDILPETKQALNAATRKKAPGT